MAAKQILAEYRDLSLMWVELGVHCANLENANDVGDATAMRNTWKEIKTRMEELIKLRRQPQGGANNLSREEMARIEKAIQEGTYIKT